MPDHGRVVAVVQPDEQVAGAGRRRRCPARRPPTRARPAGSCRRSRRRARTGSAGCRAPGRSVTPISAGDPTSRCIRSAAEAYRVPGAAARSSTPTWPRTWVRRVRFPSASASASAATEPRSAEWWRSGHAAVRYLPASFAPSSRDQVDGILAGDQMRPGRRPQDDAPRSAPPGRSWSRTRRTVRWRYGPRPARTPAWASAPALRRTPPGVPRWALASSRWVAPSKPPTARPATSASSRSRHGHACRWRRRHRRHRGRGSPASTTTASGSATRP